MANITCVIPAAKSIEPHITDKIFVGPGRGSNPIHKLESAKQYITKTTGKLANQSKVSPFVKNPDRKK